MGGVGIMSELTPPSTPIMRVITPEHPPHRTHSRRKRRGLRMAPIDDTPVKKTKRVCRSILSDINNDVKPFVDIEIIQSESFGVIGNPYENSCKDIEIPQCQYTSNRFMSLFRSSTVTRSFLADANVSFLHILPYITPEWTDCVALYVQSIGFQKRFVSMISEFPMGSPKFCDTFDNFGRAFNSALCLTSCATRFQVVVDFMKSLSCVTGHSSGWGRFLTAAISNWGFNEVSVLVNEVLNMKFDAKEEKLSVQVFAFLDGIPGADPGKELKIRSSLRNLFGAVLDPKSGNWDNACILLLAFVRYFRDIGQQARMIILLFVNAVDEDEGIFNWQSLIEDPVGSWLEAESRFLALSTCLVALQHTKRVAPKRRNLSPFSESTVFNLVEEITTTPSPWSIDNFSALIVLESDIFGISVASRVKHGYVEEAGSIINIAKSSLLRWGADVILMLRAHLDSTFRRLSLPLRSALVTAIGRNFCSQYTDMLLNLVPDGNARHELEAQLLFHPLFAEMVSLVREGN